MSASESALAFNEAIRSASRNFSNGRIAQALAEVGTAENLLLNDPSDLPAEVAVTLSKMIVCSAPALASIYLLVDKLEAMVTEGGTPAERLGLSASVLVLAYIIGRHEVSVGCPLECLAIIERGVLTACHLSAPTAAPLTTLDRLEHLWCTSKEHTHRHHVSGVMHAWSVALVQSSRIAEARAAFSRYRMLENHDFDNNDLALLEAVVDVNTGDSQRAKKNMLRVFSNKGGATLELLTYLLLVDNNPSSRVASVTQAASLLGKSIGSPSASTGAACNHKGIALAAQGKHAAAQV